MSTVDSSVTSDELCGADADGHICYLAPHPDTTVHMCRIRHLADHACGGAWFGDWNDGTFVPVIYPGGEPA